MKRLSKTIFPFTVAFIVGVIFTANFFVKENYSVVIEKETNSKSRNLIFNPPEPLKCEDISPNFSRATLIRKRAELNAWFETNKDAAKKEQEIKKKELKEIEAQIKIIKNRETWESLDKDVKSQATTRDLLYRCRKY